VTKAAVLVLKDAATGTKSYTGTSDSFGEFAIRNIEPGMYTLTITAEGFPPVTLDGIEVQTEVDLGDIAMGIA
jgi:hypothetical protein